MRVGKGSTVWLVKSSGKLLGPYSDKQICDLLKERVINPVDEISVPLGRWQYVREVAQFAKTVEELRVRNLLGPNEETTTLGGDDDLDSKTATVTPLSLDDRTQEIYGIGEQEIRDVAFKSIDDLPRQKVGSSAYTHANDLSVRQQATSTTRWLWVITVIVIFISAGTIVFRKQIAEPIKNKAAFDASTVIAMEALEAGDYKLALESFKKAHQLDSKDESIYLYLGILQIQIDNQQFMGRRLLEHLLSAGAVDLKRVHTGLGLSALYDNDIQKAEAHFQKAIEIDSNFSPAVINMGATALIAGDFIKAESYFMRSMRNEKLDGAEVLMLVDSFIRRYLIDKEVRHIAAAQQYLTQFYKQNRVYRIESKIASLYLKFLTDENAQLYTDIDDILDSDFYETEDHRLNLFVYRDLVSWQTISQWCLKMTEKLDPTARVIALEGLCLLKSGDIPGASKKIDDAMAQAPKDPLVLSTFGMYLSSTGAHDRLVVVSDKALEFDSALKFKQPLLLKARICSQRENLECQKKYWQKLLDIDSTSLAALAGLAHVHFQERDLLAAKQLLVKGLRESNAYRAFYYINKSISRSEDREKARGL